MPYHADPVEHAARYYEAQGAAADRQAALHEQMMDSFIDAVRAGRDETMPSTRPMVNGVRREGATVTEWVFDSWDDAQRALLMKALHLALCKDNAEAIHKAAAEFVESVARTFADAYVDEHWEG